MPNDIVSRTYPNTFNGALTLWRDMKAAAILQKKEYTMEHARALLSADAKTADARAAQADIATVEKRAAMEAAVADEQEAGFLVRFYLGLGTASGATEFGERAVA